VACRYGGIITCCIHKRMRGMQTRERHDESKIQETRESTAKQRSNSPLGSAPSVTHTGTTILTALASSLYENCRPVDAYLIANCDTSVTRSSTNPSVISVVCSGRLVSPQMRRMDLVSNQPAAVHSHAYTLLYHCAAAF